MKINVIVTAYNHERYISQCLESILKQKGDFQLEIIAGDDYSMDNTRRIIEEFQKNHPKVITVLPLEKNLGLMKNLKRCLNACSGKYIAICEGDDYWIDENKLQKQMDFLEIRSDCSMCFSAILLYHEKENFFEAHHAQSLLQKDAITIEDLIENNYIGNFSCCMYRADIVNKLPQEIYDLNTVDWMFNMTCAQSGSIGFIKDQMSVYRLHAKGTWTGKDLFEQLEGICEYIDVSNKFFDYKYDLLFSRRKKIISDEMLRIKSPLDVRKHGVKSFTVRIGSRMINGIKAALRFCRRIFLKSEE